MKNSTKLAIAATAASLIIPSGSASASGSWLFLVSRASEPNIIHSYNTEAECDRGRKKYVEENGSAGVGSCFLRSPLPEE